MAAFIPFSIEVIDGRSAVRWIERDAAPTAMPFFAQMIRERLASGARQRVTRLEALLTAPGPDPVGLVVHLSRCGSTLLMQALAHAGCIAPTSEATPVNQLLARSDIAEPERALLLRGLIRALGSEEGASTELPSLVKLTSWNVLFLDIVRAAFPDTPWVFLYREPLEVLASHDREPARWLSDDRFFAALTDAHRLPSLEGLAREERCAAVLAAYGQAALAASPAAANLLNYSQLPAALSTDVPARFGVPTTAEQQRHIADASRIYSKDVSRRLVFDPDQERRARPVSDRSRQADIRYSRPVHAALEWCRTGASDAGDDAPTGSRR
jgi:hypothetical protein